LSSSVSLKFAKYTPNDSDSSSVLSSSKFPLLFKSSKIDGIPSPSKSESGSYAKASTLKIIGRY
jgi:hypothetical protein